MIRLIKIIDLGFIISIYGIGGLVFAKLLDKIYERFDKAKTKTLVRNIIEMFLMLWVTGVVIYIFRNIIRMIPSPFHGLYGFDHNRVKELESMFIFTYVLLFFQRELKEKMLYIYNKI